MIKSITQIVFLLCCLIYIQGCKDSKPAEANGDATVSESSEKLKTENTDSQLSNASLKNYEIPEWPVKPRGGEGKLYPFDDASKDANFVKFRQELYNIIMAKNVNRFLAVLSDKVHFSFGEDAGKGNFIKSWKLDSAPEESGMWKELAMCLELGGKYSFYDDKKRYAAPYVHVSEVFGDPFEQGVIIGDNVRLRDGASSKAKIIGSLSWDLVEIIYDEKAVKEEINGEENYWVHVKTLKGEKGYVYGKYMRSPIDYRVGFEEDEVGAWKIIYFIAGD